MDAIRAATPPSGTAPPLSLDIRTPDASSDARGGGERRALDPAVSLDLSPDAGRKTSGVEAERRGYERDLDSNALVYRVTDALSGDIVVQIPNEVVLKARAYARQPNPPAGERLEKRA